MKWKKIIVSSQKICVHITELIRKAFTQWTHPNHSVNVSLKSFPTGSPSRGGDGAVYVFDINQPSLPTPFFFFFFFFFLLFLCLFLSFNCISLHKFSHPTLCFLTQFFRSYFCLTGPFNYMYSFMKVSFSLDVTLCGWLGLKHQLTDEIHRKEKIGRINGRAELGGPPAGNYINCHGGKKDECRGERNQFPVFNLQSLIQSSYQCHCWQQPTRPGGCKARLQR